jgi:hypothetical protein
MFLIISEGMNLVNGTAYEIELSGADLKSFMALSKNFHVLDFDEVTGCVNCFADIVKRNSV